MLRKLVTISLMIAIATLASGLVHAQKPMAMDAMSRKDPVTDTTPPTVVIEAPEEGDYVQDLVTILVNAFDSGGVAEVVCHLPDGSSTVDRRDPYSFEWDTSGLTDGEYEIRVIASDKADNETEVLLHLNLGPAPTTIPLVDIEGYELYPKFSGPGYIYATATDPEGIAKVDFYVGEDFVHTDDSGDTFSFYFDSPEYDDGWYTIKAVAYDSVGDFGEDSIEICLDSTPTYPTVSWIEPSYRITGLAPTTLYADATDDEGIWRVYFYLEGEFLGMATDFPYTFSWDTTELAEGSYELRTVALDIFGAFDDEYKTVNLVEDWVPPTVTIESPEDGQSVSQMVTVKGLADDDNEIVAVWFTVDGAFAGHLNDPPFIWEWDTDSVENGQRRISLQASDGEGSSYAHVFVNVDHSSLSTISIDYPAEQDTVSDGVTILVTAKDDDGIAEVKFSVDDTELGSDPSPPYTMAWDTEGFEEGDHSIKAVVVDAQGNYATDTVEVIVDNLPPANLTQNIREPEMGSTVFGTTRIYVTDYSTNGLESVTAYIDGLEVCKAEGILTDSYSLICDWDSRQVEDGEHTTTVMVVDDGGNIYDVGYSTFMVDNTLLPPEVSITSPVYLEVVSEITIISVDAFDPDDISEVRFYIEGIEIGVDNESPFFLEWDTTKSEEGLNEISVIAYDTLGNSAEADLVVSVDNMASPSMETHIREPGNGDTIYGTITVSALFISDNGIESVAAFLDGEELCAVDGVTVDSYTLNCEWDSSAVPDGEHSITFRVLDDLGYVYDNASTTFTTDQTLTPPTLSITSPTYLQVVSGTHTITVDVWDAADIREVVYSVEGLEIGTAAQTPYSLDWDTTQSEEGINEITAIAYDTLGNFTEASQYVSVDNVASPNLETYIKEPLNGETVYGLVTVSALFISHNGIESVTAFVDGEELCTVSDITDDGYRIYCDWESSEVPDGEHTISYLVVDDGGYEYDNASTTFTTDQTLTPPTLSITSPTYLQVVSGTHTITVDVWDADDISEVVYYIENEEIGTATQTPYSLDWDTAQAEEGINEVTVIAYDTLENSTEVSQVVSVDNDASPYLETNINEPQTGETVYGTVTLSVRMYSHNGLESVTAFIDGTEVCSVEGIASEGYTLYCDWDSDQVEDGEHTFSVAAVDDIGYEYDSGSVDFFTDQTLTPPTLSITSPTYMQVVSGTHTITVDVWDADDISEVVYSVEGLEIGTATQIPYSLDWDTTQSEEGINEVTAIAYDTLSNFTEASQQVNVDNVASPYMESYIKEPLNGETVYGPVTVSALFISHNGIESVTAFVDGEELCTVSGITDDSYRIFCDWDSSDVLDGEHTVTYTVVDDLGFVYDNASTTFTTDQTLTPPTLSITSPTYLQVVSGTHTITVDVWDADDISEVVYSVEGLEIGTATQIPYSLDWDTTQSEEGINEVTAIAYDTLSNFTEASQQVSVDNVASPYMETYIKEPLNGETVYGLVTVSALFISHNGIESVTAFVDGEELCTVSDITDDGYRIYCDWESSEVPDGEHTATFTVVDDLGYVYDHGYTTFFTDQTLTPPTLSITSPTYFQVLSGTHTITVDVWDADGISEVVYSVEGLEIGTATQTPYSLDWDTTQSEEGTNEVTAIAYDTLGNFTEASQFASVDNVPSLYMESYIKEPLNGETVYGPVTVSALFISRNGIDSVTAFLDGAELCNVNDITTDGYRIYCDWDSSDVPDGEHTATFTVVDDLGFVYDNASTTFTTDQTLTPPTLSITSPTYLQVVSGTHTITVDVWDADGISEVVYSVEGLEIGTATQTPYSLDWNTTQSEEGINEVTAIAYDTLGNFTEASQYVSVDNVVSPYMESYIKEPLNGETVYGLVTVSALFISHNGIESVTAFVDGEELCTVSGITDDGYRIYCDWESSEVPDGEHTISYLVVDDVGYEYDNASTTFSTDQTLLPPSVEIEIPADQEIVSDSVLISITSYDSDGVSLVQCFVDELEIDSATTADLITSWNSKSVSDGMHTITAIAHDARGNTAEDVITINVDNTNKGTLTVAISSPAEGTMVSGTVPILAAANDPDGLEEIFVLVDGAEIYNVGVTGETYQLNYGWDSSGFSDGSHTIEVRARNVRNDFVSDSVGVSIINLVLGDVEVVQYYSIGGVQIARRSSGEGVIYFHRDHLGSPSRLTNASGALVKKMGYRPFGSEAYSVNLAGTSYDLNYKFTGQEEDESGLYYYGTRYYDPELGRFISADVMIPELYNPQALNPYSYCVNNPVNLVDPNGEFWEFVIAGAIWGGISAAINGGNILEGMLMGAISGAVFYGATAIVGGAFGPIGSNIVAGAISGGIMSAINGGNVFEGMVQGAVSAGVSLYVKTNFGEWTKGGGGFLEGYSDRISKIAGGAAGGAANGAVYTAFHGGNLGENMIGGMKKAVGPFGLLQMVSMYITYATGETDRQYLLSCEAAGIEPSIDERGVYRTDGARIINWLLNPKKWVSFISGAGMAKEGSGGHIYDPGGWLESKYIRWFVTDVSKVHDWLNDWSYGPNGQYMSRGPVFDSIFNLYSFSGMMPAAAVTMMGYAGNMPFEYQVFQSTVAK